MAVPSWLIIDSTASALHRHPGVGGRVYTATLTNTGQTPYTGISVSHRPVGPVRQRHRQRGPDRHLRHACRSGRPGRSWTGDIPVGGTVTITGSVTVATPTPASPVLALVLASAAPGSNCPAHRAAPTRAAPRRHQVLIPALSITQTASTTSAVPGQVIGYTLTITNTGARPATPARR